MSGKTKVQGSRIGFWHSGFPNQLGNLCLLLFIFLVAQFLLFTVFEVNIFDPGDFKSTEARIPELSTRRVVDEAGVLTQAEIDALTAQIDDYEAASKGQMAVLLIRSLHGDPIEDFSMAVAEKWKIGWRGEDNGVLLLLAMDDRESRLEIGYGLEGVINDARAGDILRGMAPFMQKGKYSQAISFAIAGVSAFVLHGNGPEAPGESTEYEEEEYDGYHAPAANGPEDTWFLVFGLGILTITICLLTAKILIHPDAKKSIGLAIMLTVGWIALRILILALRSSGRSGGGGGRGRSGGGGGGFGGGGASGKW